MFNLAAHNVKQEIISSYRCEKRKAINLYNALVNDSKSIFYATDKITKTLIKKKTRNSSFKKDIVFANIYNGLEDKHFLQEKGPLNTPFV